MFEGGNHSLATNFKFGKQRLRREATYFGKNYKVTTIDDVKAEWFNDYNPDYFQKVKELMVKIEKAGKSRDGYRVLTSDFPSPKDRINTIQGNKFNDKTPGGLKTRTRYFRDIKPSVIDFNIFHRFAKWRVGKNGVKTLTSSSEYIKVGILYNNIEPSFNIVVRDKEQTDLIASTKINNKSIFNNLNL